MSSHCISVEFLPIEKTVRIERGTSFRKAAKAVGIDIAMPCGGKGRCGKCKVVFMQGAPAPTPDEQATLTETELLQGYRLGCVASIYEDAVICMPDAAHAPRILTHGTARQVPLKAAITKAHVSVPTPSIDDLRSDLTRVLDAFGLSHIPARHDLLFMRRVGAEVRAAGYDITGILVGGDLLAIEPGDTTSECYGLAFDIGTTTLAAYLLDLNTGDQIATASAMNPQSSVGDDVISRISYAENVDGLLALQASVARELNNLIELLSNTAGISRERIYDAVVVGNTCMTHLFLGIDPRYLAQAPYVPVVSQNVCVDAVELGIKINPFGRLHVLPNIAGYVGADTVAVVLATGLYQDEQLTLAVDIGTNGEIVLGSRKRMVACSTAAGPAFEGAHIRYGMRAAPGAIDAVWLDDGGMAFSTISGAKAVGICGSGLLDAVACMVQTGVIDFSGRIVDADEIPDSYALLRDRLHIGERGNEFILAEPIVITQRDVREVQLAKGAIMAGIQILMSRMGISAPDLDRIILAGAFGNYMRKESAILAGLIPDVPIEKVHAVGNAAGEGAKLSLINLDMIEDAAKIADSVEYIELTTDPGFQEKFADAMLFGEM